MRQREFESHLVLSRFFDNLVLKYRAHDVAVAYRLAMAEVRVQLPLGALANRQTGRLHRVALPCRVCFEVSVRAGHVDGLRFAKEDITRKNVQADSADDRRSTSIGYRSKRSFGAVWPNGKAAPC